MSTVSVVATVEASNTPPRVRLDVTDTGTSPSIFATTVTRLNPDGRVVAVRTQDGNPLQLTTSGASRVGLLYDYEMPLGAPVSYSTAETPGSSSASVTVASSQVWLVHPGVPGLSMPITVQTWGPRSRKVARGVFQPMGRATPVVQTDGTRKAAEYALTVLTLSGNEFDDLLDLVGDAGVVLLNVPASKGWKYPSEYISVGDITETATTRLSADFGRAWQLPCTVVARPLGGSQSQRTLDTLSSFASLDAIGTGYSSLNAVLAGP